LLRDIWISYSLVERSCLEVHLNQDVIVGILGDILQTF